MQPSPAKPALLQPLQAPPPDYYRANLFALLTFVRRTFPDLLAAEDQDYLRRLDALSQPAQRLYVRLVMRKGPLFRLDKLSYDEVGDVQAAVAELAAQQLVAWLPEAPAASVLNLLTKAEWQQLLQLPPGAASWTKGQIEGLAAEPLQRSSTAHQARACRQLVLVAG